MTIITTTDSSDERDILICCDIKGLFTRFVKTMHAKSAKVGRVQMGSILILGFWGRVTEVMGWVEKIGTTSNSVLSTTSEI